MIYTIYKLCCDDTDKFYVGSTKNRKERVRRHRDDSKVKDTLINKTIREFGGWENWRMVDLEEYTCDTRRDAQKREEYWRVELKADLNMVRCSRLSVKEYYASIRDKELERKRVYRENNRELINQRARDVRRTQSL